MSAYDALAPWYDALTPDVPYEQYADFYERVFAGREGEFKLLLDLCCGTGTLALMMSGRGYDMIAADGSEEMLMCAREKAYGAAVPMPLFICQRAGELDLYGTVDAAYSSLDSLSYVPQDELDECFRRLRLFIRPGGVLVFDLRTPEFLRGMDGSVSVDETDDVFCVWRGRFDEEAQALRYGMDIFSRVKGDTYSHANEEHIEYAHDLDAVTALLAGHGFTDIRTRPDGPMAGADRVFIEAVRGE